MLQTQTKTKCCRQCNKVFIPRKPMQRVCDLNCAIAESRSKSARKAQAVEKRAHRARKAALRTITDEANAAQQMFNQWVKYRDWGKPCISCGQPAHIGARHASHYRSRKAASQLRYHPDNVRMSCAQCNVSKSGNVVEYRIALVKLIGDDRVLSLEHNNSTRKWGKDELKRIARIYRRKAKHYAKLRGEH